MEILALYRSTSMAEPPRKKLKGSTILDIFGRKSGCDSFFASQVDPLDAANATYSADDFGAIVDVLLLYASEKEESDSYSHR